MVKGKGGMVLVSNALFLVQASCAHFRDVEV
jgi:hypothetical protein